MDKVNEHIQQERIIKVIQSLSAESLVELEQFVAYLYFKETHTPNPDWFGKVYDLFEPVRHEAVESGVTEDEINTLIDEAIAEVRGDSSN